MALDYSGYQFTYLDLSVASILFRTRVYKHCHQSLKITSAFKQLTYPVIY